MQGARQVQTRTRANPSPSRSDRHWSSAFWRDERGATAAIFAIVFSAILLASAVAIDFARGTAEQVREQFALDAAALAATDKLGGPDEEAAVAATAEAYLNANRHRTSNAALKEIQVNPGDGTISGTAGGTVDNLMMKVFGSPTTNVFARTRVTRTKNKIEVVLVLDNSEALAGQPLDDLKAAAKGFVGLLFQGASGSDDISVGIVPFAGAVNVGANYRGQTWLDNTAQAPTHFENLDKPANRFSLFDSMGTSWAGCVEVRPAPYDVSEAAPNPGEPASLFVPLFAPDEPDEINAAGDTYTNNYMTDSGGTCTPQVAVCESYSKRGNCARWTTPPIPALQAQQQTCKYTNTTLDTSASGPTRKGPNMHCDARPLTRMTNRKASLISAIDAMQAAGAANIGEGVMWGWRVISPNAPFADGRAYGSTGTRKIMIVLARGANWAEGLRNINDSSYSAWGFGVNNRLNPNSHTTSALTNSMNEMARSACRGASDKGVEVYTIGFGESDAHTRSMLQYCATTPHMSFDANNMGELMAVFEGISKGLLQLRISG